MEHKHSNETKPAASEEIGEEGAGSGDTTSDEQPIRDTTSMHISAPRAIGRWPIADERPGRTTQRLAGPPCRSLYLPT